VDFCSNFDEALANNGPAAVFLLDQEGKLRFDARWTRDNWGRAPGPHEIRWRWTLFRDRRSGFVFLALVTSPTLIEVHPRLEIQSFGTYEQAVTMKNSYGNPPIAPEPWG